MAFGEGLVSLLSITEVVLESLLLHHRMLIETLILVQLQLRKLKIDNYAIRMRYYWNMIASFKDDETELIWKGRLSKKIKLPFQLHDIARRKLRMLAAATTLETLRVPPNNRLEALRGNRTGQWSIRINDQWRICFKWKDGNAIEVEITDYH